MSEAPKEFNNASIKRVAILAGFGNKTPVNRISEGTYDVIRKLIDSMMKQYIADCVYVAAHMRKKTIDYNIVKHVIKGHGHTFYGDKKGEFVGVKTTKELQKYMKSGADKNILVMTRLTFIKRAREFARMSNNKITALKIDGVRFTGSALDNLQSFIERQTASVIASGLAAAYFIGGRTTLQPKDMQTMIAYNCKLSGTTAEHVKDIAIEAKAKKSIKKKKRTTKKAKTTKKATEKKPATKKKSSK